MAHDRYIAIEVAYDSHPSYGRSLEWIAPELSDAGLTLIEDHTNRPLPARTWAGPVDKLTFERFADAWHLGYETDGSYTLDGMNWEVGGESPIVCVTVHVAEQDGKRAASPAIAGPP